MRQIQLALALALPLVGSGCAARAGGQTAAVKSPTVEVVYQASTDITDNGSQINGKLCFHQTHFERSAVAASPGAVDLLGWNRHFVVGPMSPSENRVVGSIAVSVPSGSDGFRAMLGENGTDASATEELHHFSSNEYVPDRPHTEEHEAVDLRYSLDHLVGRVGWNQFVVKTVGDHMEGQYQFNSLNPVNIKIYGVDKVMALPIAEQGVLLPSLLYCLQKVPTHDFEMTLADLVRKS